MNHPEKQPVFERGGGNVFADLGLDNTDETFARSQLGFQVWKILKARNLKEREIADLWALNNQRYLISWIGSLAASAKVSLWIFWIDLIGRFWFKLMPLVKVNASPKQHYLCKSADIELIKYDCLRLKRLTIVCREFVLAHKTTTHPTPYHFTSRIDKIVYFVGWSLLLQRSKLRLK